jgi:TfoX/Sxy family transcriptional regulator of competence genes
MSYWEIPGEVLEDEDELARWATKALAAAKEK